ncbi:hypothetical protein [uncultured Dokdonia sp.]|uniref:hypothetical protein n=1 Tax=uncultured Dokdonia sp. TaxID=575653 RepID=UPI00263919B0|nr:hypothetical protein [uncultured Dokdonia sp.]
MKKLLLAVIAITFLFTSCETENETFETSTSDLVFKFENDFTNSIIGEGNGDSFQLLVSDASIMKAAKTFVEKQELDLVPESYKIEIIDGKEYLRIYSNDSFVSTIALIIDSERGFRTTGSTVCTSSSCASGGGCVPRGEYCTKCTELAKECHRTTTGEIPR